jgi:hypothetical protein
MRHERHFLVDVEASSVIEPYAAWIRGLIYLSAATFGIVFWSALILLIFK